MAAFPADCAVRQVYVRAESQQGGSVEACLALSRSHTVLRDLLSGAVGEEGSRGAWVVDSSPDGVKWTAGNPDLPLAPVTADYGHKFFVFHGPGAERLRGSQRSRSRTPVPAGAGAPSRCPSLKAKASPAWQRRAQTLRLLLLALAGALPAAAAVWGFNSFYLQPTRPVDAARMVTAAQRTVPAPPATPPPRVPPRPVPPKAAPVQQAAAAPGRQTAAAVAVLEVAAAVRGMAVGRGAEEAVAAALRELAAIQSRMPGPRRRSVEAIAAKWLAASLAAR
eukprot:TRINITY_DN8097_c0_g1_i1.p1 TRINITY_DN8097_c0_g1~~TRINITY_DN8097_c0_g1_i1.p1  ORF type:complete len:301 (+),score=88.10 TRINITY_DN8097_c0_g1_i1:69-905(+)